METNHLEQRSHLVAVESRLRQVENELQKNSQTIGDIAAGRCEIILRPIPPHHPPSINPQPTFPANLPLHNPQPLPTNEDDIQIDDNASENTPADTVMEPAVVPAYRMSRTLTTIVDLWREYTTGIGGGPAVKELEGQFRSSWRSSEGEKRFFLRR